MRIALVSAALLLAVSCSSKTGPQGPQGETGPQGPAGPAGAQGPQGERGETGATGATGATGETGAQGPQGLQGPQGAVLVVDGGVVIGPPGSSVVVTALTSGDPACANGGVRITQLSDGGITNLCNGAQGSQGPQGPQGPAGAQGIPGPQGIQGATGPQGPMGPTGAGGASVTATVLANMSAQCMTGGVLLGFADGGTLAVCNGAQGAQGLQGATGPQGLQGPQGNPGATGSTGPQGATGSAGPAGPQGPMGATGPTGPAGAVLYVDGGVVARSSWVAFAGFTAATYNGNLGGIVGANTKCDAEYPGSFFCSMSDYSRAETNATPGAIGAWVDYERSSTGNRDTSGCYKSGTGAWTEPTSAYYANTINANGYATSSNCNVVHSLACCRSSHPTVFRGFTSATYTGDLGGIVGANSKCATQYPGSFFCTMSDYARAETNASPGATGAWVDYERSSTGNRDTSGCYKSGTGAWTEPTSVYYANTINANGYAASSNCNVVHTLACCSNN